MLDFFKFFFMLEYKVIQKKKQNYCDILNCNKNQ